MKNGSKIKKFRELCILSYAFFGFNRHSTRISTRPLHQKTYLPLKKKKKLVIGLYAINESNPTALTKAWAYINQFNKLRSKPEYLDSAQALLKDRNKESITKNMSALFH